MVQIMAHSARTFLTPRNRNWRKPRACLICPNTGSTTCFLNSVRRFEAAVVDLFAHQLRQRSTNFSVCRCRVLARPGCDIAVDTTCDERAL